MMTDKQKIKKLLAALKGARDALDHIPEGIRGVHDSTINRQLERIDKVIYEVSEVDIFDNSNNI